MNSNLIKAVPDVFNCKPKSKFSLSKHLSRFESWEDARKRRKALVKALKRHRPEETDLIQCLEICEKDSRCRLLCCPICMRVLRSWFCDQVAPLVEKGAFRMVTLVPDRHRHNVGTLHAFKPQRLIDDFRSALKKFGLKNVIVFGSIDYCEQIIRDSAGKYHRVWSPHLHLMSNISEKEWDMLKVELGRYFPKTANVKVPVQMHRLVEKDFEILKPISYCVKSSFYSTYTSRKLPQPETISNTSPKTPQKRPKKQRMSGKFQAELASEHSRQRLKDRIILIGLKHVQKSIVETASFSSHR